MERAYYARSENELHEKETVQRHLKRAAELCGNFLSVLTYEDFGQALGTFHDIGKYMERFQQENTIPMLYSSLPEFKWQEDVGLAKMLFTRFLFSALVDADYSSSAEHFEPDYLTAHTGPALNPAISIERLLDVQAQKKKTSNAASSLNQMRDQLFENCRLAAKLPPGLFTLTAPTGLGKTLSLFAFAAEHCQEHGKRRIILILPYLSIIDQNLKDYRQVEPDLLECHSNAELSEDAQLLAQRWETPCIVTTNVGFFEPLFSAQPTACRHLHAIANSVIVLDEAQSLPPHLLDATLRTVKLLCEQYRCTVVFSTATMLAAYYGLRRSEFQVMPPHGGMT